MTETEKKLVIVSGASSGIGLALVKSLLQSGYAVLGISRTFDDPISEHPDFRFEAIDLAEIDSLPTTMASLEKSIRHPIKALVNNAGIGKMGYLEQLSVADISRSMNVNFLSHAIITKAFLPRLKQQGAADIVFVGSEAALRGSRQGSAYCASKFALRGFAQALRDECGRSGVRIGLVNPGAVRSAFFNELDFEPGAELQNALTPEQVAAVIMSQLDADTGMVIDEVNLSPLTQVWQRKS
jgi:3-hydroxy acid dehydrogenase / malonic semialdehyde reductase